MIFDDLFYPGNPGGGRRLPISARKGTYSLKRKERG